MTSLFASLPIFADGTAAPAPSGAQSLITFLPMVLIFVAMYFLMIAPQRKKQKEHQKMLESLDSGDQIITAGGIYGEITNKKDDRFVVRIADNTKIEIGKSFITTVVKKLDAAK